jgi:outer membrane receptor protein involved in Fe transport
MQPTTRRSREAKRCSGWRLAGATALAGLMAAGLAPAVAFAQQGAGAFTGVVTDAISRQPLEGVVVRAQSPGMQDEQIGVTDKTGFYRVSHLLPGTFEINFERDGYFSLRQTNIALRSDTTLRLNAALAPTEGATQSIEITDRPVVDVGSSTTSTTIDANLLKRVPLSAPGAKGSASRTIESVAEVAPGVSNDHYGAGINGASSPENHYSVDGLSVGNPGKGVLGTALSTEFVSEVNVVTAGYMPEYGRATGGVLNAVTKSGSNSFRASIWSFVSPGALEGERKLVKQSAQPVTYGTELSYIGDVGFDLGGPILKDKLWFYTGVDVSNTRYNIKRSIFRTTNRTAANPDGEIEGTPIYTQDFIADARTYQGMAKLTWSLNSENRLTFAAYGAPVVSGGGAKFDGTNVTPGRYSIDPLTGAPEAGSAGTYSSSAHQFKSTPIDASLKWNSQFLDKRLLLDVMVGTHFQKDSMRASDGSSALDSSGIGAYYNVNYRRNTPFHSITDFESFPTAARCNEANFDCLVSDYTSGAPRDLNEATYNRYQSSIIVSYLANLWGHHLIKAGFESELTSFRNQKSNRVFTESEDGSQFNDEERFGVLTAPDTVQFIDPLTKKTQSLTVGGFLQDSWSVADKVTVNLGLRYDSQYYFNNAGNVGLSLPNQWSPRLGLIYDPTQSGRAKLYANYARYYENAPLGFADVVLVGEPQVRGGHACNPVIWSQHRNECQQPANLRPNSQDDPRAPNQIYTAGGSAGTLDPDIEASSSDEVSMGGEYELIPDARLGVNLTRRWINKWIEDMNPVVGLNGFAGNPGYGLGASLPKVERVYRALTVYLAKSFSQQWLAQASYTLGSLRGNYSGLFAPEDNYLGPNGTADFDSPNVSNNRYGALKGDIRHSVKLMGAKDWRINNRMGLGTGLSLRARSGAPTSYLAADPYTYSMESYLVERGIGPRLPWIFTADLQLAYRVAAFQGMNVSVTADVFNLLNFQRATETDEEYTTDNVVATQGYKVADLPNLKNDEGQAVVKRPGFGQVTEYQEPRVFRFGLRGEF